MPSAESVVPDFLSRTQNETRNRAIILAIQFYWKREILKNFIWGHTCTFSQWIAGVWSSRVNQENYWWVFLQELPARVLYSIRRYTKLLILLRLVFTWSWSKIENRKEFRMQKIVMNNNNNKPQRKLFIMSTITTGLMNCWCNLQVQMVISFHFNLFLNMIFSRCAKQHLEYLEYKILKYLKLKLDIDSDSLQQRSSTCTKCRKVLHLTFSTRRKHERYCTARHVNGKYWQW